MSQHSAGKSQEKFSCIDLFAGIGGIRLGFESHGARCVFTAERDRFCRQTYEHNFGQHAAFVGDIVACQPADIPAHDVLLAGFPCQPFSIAGVSKKNSLGRPHGFKDKTQGTLFFNVAQILAEKRPAAFLLENVKNLLNHDKGNTFKVIQDVLKNELGYHLSWRVIDAKHFVPQHRERILIAGFREAVPFDFAKLVLPAPSQSMQAILHTEDGREEDVDAGRYLDDKGKVRDKYILSENMWDYLQRYAEKHRKKGNGFGYGLVTPDDISRTLSARYYKDGSEILVSRGKRKRPRRLTPRECARLMGYPASWLIPVSDTQAYKQFGNSVAVPVIQAVAGHMKPHILAIKRAQTRGHR